MAWYIFKDRIADGVCQHGAAGCLCHYELYFDGTLWDMVRRNALKYNTKAEAESAAFMLVVTHGEDTGKLSVKEMAWERDDDE